MTEPLTAEQLVDGLNLLSVHVTDLEARVAGHRDADDQLAIKSTALKALWDMLGVTDQTAACDRVITLTAAEAPKAKDSEQRAEQRVSDEEIDHDIAFWHKTSEPSVSGYYVLDLRDARADVARLTGELAAALRTCATLQKECDGIAAKDAEIARLKQNLNDTDSWGRDNLARAERAEADLRAARTVDDAGLSRATIAIARHLFGEGYDKRPKITPFLELNGWMADALTAALSPGQAGGASPYDEPTERERIIEAETSQSHDQAAGDDESDAAFLKRSAAWGIVNTDPDFKRLHTLAARRASQPRAAAAAVERLRKTWDENRQWPETPGQTVYAIIVMLRTLPSAPLPIE